MHLIDIIADVEDGVELETFRAFVLLLFVLFIILVLILKQKNRENRMIIKIETFISPSDKSVGVVDVSFPLNSADSKISVKDWQILLTKISWSVSK